MKLSMWMIANRISSLDMEINFNNDTPVILKSARRAYATNCVHVFQSGSDVICNGEGNYIRLKDMSVDQAFEIIQSIFDFYEDWHNTLIETAQTGDYQKLIDSCYHVFHSPLLLFDGNCRVLAMSSQYPGDSLDNEWKYLSIYGYSSITAIQFIKHDYSRWDFTSSKIQKYHFNQGSSIRKSGITAGIYYEDSLCGRVNLLEHERIFNQGDYQILEQIIEHLVPSLGKKNPQTNRHSCHNIFYTLIQGEKAASEELTVQMEYMHWNLDNTFRITLLAPKDSSLPNDYLHILSQVIRNCVLSSYNFILNNKIILITNENLLSKEQFTKTLAPILKQNNLKMAVSLPASGIANISHLYEQALAAFSYGALHETLEDTHDIYDYALDYIIESKDMKCAFYACHPDILNIWMQKKEIGPDMLLTFQTWLNNERSIIITAQTLYVHRNTIIYRIKKISEMLHYDLEDAYTRDYMKLSLKVLNLYDKKYKNK